MVAPWSGLSIETLSFVPMFRNNQKSIATLRVRAFMRVLFGLFLFVYFYFLQSPLLSLVQLHLSEGKTVYYPLVSAVVLSGLLLLVQKLVAKWIDFTETLYFFSYVPSVILAVVTTAFTPTMNVPVLVFCAVALVGFVLAAVICVKLSPHEERDNSYARLLTTHALGMVFVMSSLGLFSNSNDVTTYEIQTAHLIQNLEYEEALHIGQRSAATSSRLTALRAYALSHTPQGMGERLFTYPLTTAGAEQLLFAQEDTLAQLLPPDSLYAELGVWRSEKETAIQFLQRALQRNEKQIVKDYWLTGLLLERNLEKFVSDFSACCPDSVALPRHYQEALVLYRALYHRPVPQNVDSAVTKSYEDYRQLGEQYEDALVRRNQLYRAYSNTYWWYFDYLR